MKLIYNEHEGQGAYVESYRDVSAKEHEEKISEILGEGFSVFEKRENRNSFTIFKKDSEMRLVAYYPGIAEMRVVTEPNSTYFSFKDTPCEEKTVPTVTQIDLEDYGLSYVVRLCDGRFIIFDGGFEFEPDADKLLDCLKKKTPHEKPIIAAWIMTHTHVDHYRCYLVFDEKYHDEVIIERFIYNFPDAIPDEERLPDIMKRVQHVARFFAAVEKSGAEVYKAHTGQTFSIGGAEMDIISSPDDTFFVPIRDFNHFSIVIKMTIAGQTILWTADSYMKQAKLAARYGEYLKSDILQIPHHCFVGGDAEAYSLIDPHTCLNPGFEEHTLGVISLHREYKEDVRRLLYALNVQEFYAGGYGNIDLALPHTPRSGGKQQILDRINEIQHGLGACSWYFDGLTKDNCDFTIINPIWSDATVYCDLLFDDSKIAVENIKITAPKKAYKRINLMDPADADPEALYYNPNSLGKKGVPDGGEFVAHFKSNKPIIITAKKPAAYKG